MISGFFYIIFAAPMVDHQYCTVACIDTTGGMGIFLILSTQMCKVEEAL